MVVVFIGMTCMVYPQSMQNTSIVIIKSYGGNVHGSIHDGAIDDAPLPENYSRLDSLVPRLTPPFHRL